MDLVPRSMDKAKVLPAVLGTTSFLVLLSLLHPADAYHPSAAGSTITPTSFAYLPCVAHAEPTCTPVSPGVDLIIWDIDIEPQVPAVGETFVITVTARNQGADDASQGTDVRLNVGGWQFDKFIAPLAACAKVDTPWALSLSSAGPYTARGEVDPRDIVPESREDNNVLEQSFVVVSSSG